MITAQAGTEGFDGTIRLAEQQLPGARQMSGFKSYQLLIDAETGEVVIISLWENPRADGRGHSRGRAVRPPGQHNLATAGLTEQQLGTYEVTLAFPT